MPVSGSDIVAAADVLEAQIEKVRNKVQELFETTDNVAALIRKGGEAEVISQKLYRIPLVLYRGGIFRSFNADAGDMGSGSGVKVSKITAGFLYSDYVVEMSLQTMDTTATSGQSVLNAFAYNFKNAMKELQTMDDIVFHTNGTGVITSSVGASANSTWGSSSNTTLTFAAATDSVGVSRVRPGMAVDVYSNDLTTKRSTTNPQQLFVDHVDYTNKIVYLSDVVTAVANTDVLAIAGLSATLASFQSTWPLAGDSFRHGLYYVNDANSSNYFLGQLKSNITELLANNVSANALLTHAHGLQLQDQIINRRDESAFSGLVGIAHMAQRAQVYNIGIALSEWYRGSSDKMIDVMPSGIKYSDTFPFAGVTCKVDKRQDKSRIDFIIPKLWGRAMLHDTKFHDVQGRTVFESRTSTGTLKAAVHFILTQAFDYYSVDPGAQGYISNLTVPSGY